MNKSGEREANRQGKKLVGVSVGQFSVCSRTLNDAGGRHDEIIPLP